MPIKRLAETNRIAQSHTGIPKNKMSIIDLLPPCVDRGKDWLFVRHRKFRRNPGVVAFSGGDRPRVVRGVCREAVEDNARLGETTDLAWERLKAASSANMGELIRVKTVMPTTEP